MPSLGGGKCHETYAEAIQAQCALSGNGSSVGVRQYHNGNNFSGYPIFVQEPVIGSCLFVDPAANQFGLLFSYSLGEETVNVNFADVSCTRTPDPFNLTPGEGVLIGGAVAAVWATAWAWRQLAAMVRSDGVASERD